MKRLLKYWVLSLAMIFTSMNANSQISVSGAAGSVNGSYTSFTNLFGVFSALNAGGSQAGQNIIISVTGNVILEFGSNSLNAGNWTSITISPSGSRSVSGSVAGPLFNFNGADNVTINGLNASGNSLTISNSSISGTAGTSTIRFINGASNNTVTNCEILGSSQNFLGTGGGTIFFSTDKITSNGNDNNLISNCNIGPAGLLLPFKAILGLGSTSSSAIRNSGNVIDNNNIYNFFGNGLGNTSGVNILSGNDSWTVSNNRIYQTFPRTFLGNDLRYSGITLNTSTLPGSFTITGNKIGFDNSAGTGTTEILGLTNEVRGIDAANVSLTTATIIENNTISGIIQTSARISLDFALAGFAGISMGSSGGLVNATYNTIGSTDGSSFIVLNHLAVTLGSAPVIGILNVSSSNANISFNKIGYIIIQGLGTVTGFKGILVATATSLNATISENLITNIVDNQVGVYDMAGIQTTFPNAFIYNNVIRNFVGNSIAADIAIGGILATGSTGNNNIEKNRIYNLLNIDIAGVAGTVYGINVLFPLSSNEIKQNYVFGLSVNSVLDIYQIYGIVRGPGGNGNVYNNMVSLGLNYDGSTIVLGFHIVGIRDIGGGGPGSFNYYYNTVYIGGTAVLTSVFNTFAFFSDEFFNSREIIDNIFWNDRSNAIILGAPHFAICVGGINPNPIGLTCNYNILYAPGIDGAVGLFDFFPRWTLNSWKNATGQDVNSSSVSIPFVSPVFGDLHHDGSQGAIDEFIGTPIPGITTDIDKTDRDPDYPYIGADEGEGALPVELASFTFSTDGPNVTLNWVTSSEMNNSGFDIERREERRETQDVWNKVGSVNGNGTSSGSHSYLFTDKNLTTGTYSYRLKQVDLNGNFEYFNLNSEVNVGIPTKYSLSQNYPNPFNPTTNLEFGISNLGFVSLKVYDISGKEVMTLLNEQKSPGYYSVSFNASNLSSGIYFYVLKAGDFVSTKKMTLLK